MQRGSGHHVRVAGCADERTRAALRRSLSRRVSRVQSSLTPFEWRTTAVRAQYGSAVLPRGSKLHVQQKKEPNRRGVGRACSKSDAIGRWLEPDESALFAGYRRWWNRCGQGGDRTTLSELS